MAEATSNLSPNFVRIQLTTAARCLAMLRSRNAVKDQIRKQGLKLSQYSAAEITSWASLYLDDHHETLIAIEEAKRMILAGVLGKRAQRALRASLTTDAQTQMQPNSMGSTVQMSGAK